MSRKRKHEDKELLAEETIERYGMSDLEAVAVRLVVVWIEKSRKAFPDYRHATLNRGDPRKSLMFKICYKLVRETQGVLEESEYSLYVRAQLDVLKHICKNQGNPLIDPNCLVGDKAWKRWKLWKRRYDMVSVDAGSDGRAYEHGALKALDGLEKTKEFLVKNFGPELEEVKYRQAVLNKNIYRWMNIGKISPYYVAISPIISRTVPKDELDGMNFHPDVYRPCVNAAVVKRFNELFPGEKLDPSHDWSVLG